VHRILASFVAALLLVLSMGSALAQPVFDEVTEYHAYRGADVLWVKIRGNVETYYGLYLAELFAEPGEAPHKYVAWFRATACRIPEQEYREGRCVDEVDHRVNVVSFEMDPLLMSAHAVLEWKGERSEVTWTGDAETDGRPAGSNSNHSMYVPERTDVFASAWVSVDREAKASGDLFGVQLHEDEVDWGYMTETVWGDQWVCVAMESCEDIHRRSR
jgi:hypothetical protein